MNLRILLPATLMVFACGASFAESDSNGTGLFLEPGVTYQMTESNVNYASGLINSNATTKGFGVMVRAGIHVYDRFFVAADGRYSMLKYNDNANHYTESASGWDLSPVIGIQMPDMGPRLFAGYIVTGSLDPKGTNGIDPMLDQASGFRVGAGLKMRQCSVNLEWQSLRYGKSELQLSNGAAPISFDYKSDGMVASVSFPIDFN